jgi:hypothetical protein
MNSARRLAFRFTAAYFNVGDLILYGKYKNKKGIIKEFGQDPKGNPTIVIEPTPKGRKQDKLMGLFKIWKAPSEMQETMTKAATLRLVARYIKAFGIDVGRTLNVGSVRIHRYNEAFLVHDLTNAGKRGKKVKVLSIGLGIGSAQYGQRQEWFEMLAKTLPNHETYESLKSYVNSLKQDDPYIYANEREERGIDVEPTGNKITLKTNTGLVIESSPKEFRVLNREPLDHPKTGKPIGFQDTNYYDKGTGSAAVFFTWLQANLSKVNALDMNGLRKVWDALDVKYDYQ